MAGLEKTSPGEVLPKCRRSPRSTPTWSLGDDAAAKLVYITFYYFNNLHLYHQRHSGSLAERSPLEHRQNLRNRSDQKNILAK